MIDIFYADPSTFSKRFQLPKVFAEIWKLSGSLTMNNWANREIAGLIKDLLLTIGFP